MRRAFIAVVVAGEFAALLSVPALGQVSPRQLLRERIVSLLDAPGPLPPASKWRTIGPARKTNAELIDIAQEDNQPLRRRGRAVEALAAFSTKATQQFLWQLVDAPHVPGLLRKLALRSLGGAFREQVLFDLEARLRDDDAYIRAGAALGLALVGDHRVRAMLEAALYAEPQLDVRLVIEKALATVRAREHDAQREELGAPSRPEPNDHGGRP